MRAPVSRWEGSRVVDGAGPEAEDVCRGHWISLLLRDMRFFRLFFCPLVICFGAFEFVFL